MFDRHHVVRGVLFMEFGLPQLCCQVEGTGGHRSCGRIACGFAMRLLFMNKPLKSWLENHAATSFTGMGMSFV